MSSAQFMDVGAETVALESFTPTGDDTSDNVMIQTLDAYGREVATYQWINWAGDSGNQEAWVDGDYAIVEGVTFPAGQGLWIQASSGDQGMQTAGKVPVQDVSVSLCAGFTAAGNPYPVAVNLQDILAEGDDVSDNVMIQTLDAYGREVATYQWINWAGDSGNQEAWVDGDYAIVEGVSFPAGKGLWIQGSSSTQSVRFPAPEL